MGIFCGPTPLFDPEQHRIAHIHAEIRCERMPMPRRRPNISILTLLGLILWFAFFFSLVLFTSPSVHLATVAGVSCCMLYKALFSVHREVAEGLFVKSEKPR